MNAIEAVKSVHPKCSTLTIKNKQELHAILWSLGLLYDDRIKNRIINTEDLIGFIVNNGMFNITSKTELNNLIKGNGIKLNNLPLVKNTKEIKWLVLDDIEYAILKRGKNDFDFIFKTKNINL